jgi:heme/copper-type cytochrome/quinol oxidase subunit 2
MLLYIITGIYAVCSGVCSSGSLIRYNSHANPKPVPANTTHNVLLEVDLDGRIPVIILIVIAVPFFQDCCISQ